MVEIAVSDAASFPISLRGSNGCILQIELCRTFKRKPAFQDVARVFRLVVFDLMLHPSSVELLQRSSGMLNATC